MNSNTSRPDPGPAERMQPEGTAPDQAQPSAPPSDRAAQQEREAASARRLKEQSEAALDNTREGYDQDP